MKPSKIWYIPIGKGGYDEDENAILALQADLIKFKVIICKTWEGRCE